jgi:hypothetical protein
MENFYMKKLLAKEIIEHATDVFQERLGVITSFNQVTGNYIVMWDTDARVGTNNGVKIFEFEPVTNISPAELLHGVRYKVRG